MSHAERPAYPPIDQTERVASSVAISWLGLNSTIIEEIHQEIQSQLTLLEQAVRRRFPNIRATAGRTSGRAFLLFSYKTFSLEDKGVDPAVAGITLSQVGDKLQLECDISGESTGDVIVAIPKTVVPLSKPQLVEATRLLAGRIANSADVVVTALQDSSRRLS